MSILNLFAIVLSSLVLPILAVAHGQAEEVPVCADAIDSVTGRPKNRDLTELQVAVYRIKAEQDGGSTVHLFDSEDQEISRIENRPAQGCTEETCSIDVNFFFRDQRIKMSLDAQLAKGGFEATLAIDDKRFKAFIAQSCDSYKRCDIVRPVKGDPPLNSRETETLKTYLRVKTDLDPVMEIFEQSVRPNFMIPIGDDLQAAIDACYDIYEHDIQSCQATQRRPDERSLCYQRALDKYNMCVADARSRVRVDSKRLLLEILGTLILIIA